MPAKLTRYNDLAAATAVVTSEYGWGCGGCDNRVTSIHHRRAADDALLHDIDITRDGAGNPSAISDAEGDHVYSYDGARRLLSATHAPDGAQPDETYSYDAVGNRLSSHLSTGHEYGYMSGAGGSLLMENDAAIFVYDKTGSVILRTDKGTGEYVTFGYDHRRRLTDVVQHASDGEVVHTSSYAYDPADRRIRIDQGDESTHVFYDGRNPILELADDGSLLTRRLYARGLDQILADQVGDQTRWFLLDHVGSVRDLVDAEGKVLTHYTYDTFGRLLAQSDPSVQNTLLFNARELDPATGLLYYRARTYDPGLGRFMQTDPQAPYQFTFAENNPNVFIDPSGEAAFVEHALLLAAISGTIALLFDAHCQFGDPNSRWTTVSCAAKYIFYVAAVWLGYASASSERYKTDIRTLRAALARVKRLRGVRYKWRHDGSPDLGLIAEEVARVVPEAAIIDKKSGLVTGVKYGHLVGLLVEAMKEQQTEIEALQRRNDALEGRLQRIEAALEALSPGALAPEGGAK